MRLAALAQGWLLTAAGLCAIAAPLAAAEGWHTDFEAARKEAQQTGKPLLVHFWAEWCGPCKQMDSSVFNQPQVVQTLRSDVVAVKVNVDQNQELSKRFGIERLPSDVFLETGGERILESDGFRNPGEYVEMLHRAKARQTELAQARAKRAQQQQLATAAPQPGGPTAEQVKPSAQQVSPMLDGYCPVTLWNSRKWIKGSAELKSDFRGQVYYFATPEAMDSFNQDQRRYTPRFLGCDPVIVWESDRAVRGTTKFAAFYDDELYLFTTAENRDNFKSTPDKYIRTRIVLQPEEIETVVR
jgi:YHS domain-containing protein/thiol-disulfide isomerase/thioredoxin